MFFENHLPKAVSNVKENKPVAPAAEVKHEPAPIVEQPLAVETPAAVEAQEVHEAPASRKNKRS